MEKTMRAKIWMRVSVVRAFHRKVFALTKRANKPETKSEAIDERHRLDI